MSAIGVQPLPDALVFFLVATERLEPPEPVNKTLQLLRDICRVVQDDESTGRNRRKPRDILNRRIGQARRRNAERFLELALWADSVEVGSACYWTGDYWQCLQAFTQIYLGASAHSAFGMNEGGNPCNPGFTRIDDAVFRAEMLIQQGIPVMKALERGCELSQLGLARWREAEKHRSCIRAGGPSGLVLIDPFSTINNNDSDDDHAEK